MLQSINTKEETVKEEFDIDKFMKDFKSDGGYLLHEARCLIEVALAYNETVYKQGQDSLAFRTKSDLWKF